MELIYGPAGDRDADAVYLFECDCEPVVAISRDRAGANLPRNVCSGAWRMTRSFMLGVKEAMPFAIDPEPVLRGLMANGYYLCYDKHVRNPSGTSQ
jgi:hypothetical protein